MNWEHTPSEGSQEESHSLITTKRGLLKSAQLAPGHVANPSAPGGTGGSLTLHCLKMAIMIATENGYK